MNAGLVEGRGLGQYWDDFLGSFFVTAPRAVLLLWTVLGTNDGAESFIGVEVSVWI